MVKKERVVSEEDWDTWMRMCEYIHKEILQYPKDCKFPTILALRLQGLHKGQFMANKYIKPMANYSYEIIWTAFKVCKHKLVNCLGDRDKYKDEKHRINTMMVIIEREINDVYFRMQNAKKSVVKVEAMQLDNQVHEGAEYKAEEIKENKELDKLW